jgi:hypothetical protein
MDFLLCVRTRNTERTLVCWTGLQSPVAEGRGSGYSALFALQVLTGMPPPEKQPCLTQLSYQGDLYGDAAGQIIQYMKILDAISYALLGSPGCK